MDAAAGAFPLDARLADHVARLVDHSQMTGCAVGIVDRAGARSSWFAGSTDSTGETRVHAEVWWDLASLTKVLVTLPALLSLVATGRVDLDVPLAAQWGRARHRPFGVSTPAQLLSHSAGLPAHRPFHELDLGPRTVLVEHVMRTELSTAPGGAAVYSDIGFILLGEYVAERSFTPLTDVAAAAGLTYGPITGVAAATEVCPWRQRLIVGEVHDENAFALDGVAGHAGAFGTLDDVVDAALALLQDTAPLHLESVRRHSSNRDGEQFGLGWWLPPTHGIGGTRYGTGSYGMSGFTGTRIWVEPTRDYAVVILSNRIHPKRGDREPFTRWCTELLDTVAATWSTR
ncbi:serine hydrolase domain-containing protein [Pseudonocardia xishanensis]